MEPFTKLHVQILMSKMKLLKENMGILSKLLIFSYCLLLFLVSFGEKLHVQILMSKMELLKENIGILSKLLILSYCLLLFLVSFGEKLSLLL
jgi:hypothetical protein